MAKGLFSRREPGAMLSLVAHVGALVFALYSFSSAKPFDPATESVPVDVMSEKEFSDMMKGVKTGEKTPEPVRRVDKVAETKDDKDPGQAKKDVDAPPPKAAEAPPPPKADPKPEPRQEARPEPVKPPPAPPSPPKLASVVPPPPLRTAPPVKAPAAKTEEEDEDEADAEVIKQKVPKKAEPKAEPKPEPKPAPEKQRLEEKLRADQKAAEDAKRKAEADAKAKAEAKAKADAKARADAKAAADAKEKLLEKLEAEAEAKEKAEEARKLADAKAKAEAAAKAQAVAEAKAKAEAAAKAKAAADAKAKAAADAKAKSDAESNKLNDAIRNRLLASREAPSSTGSTGAAVSRQASLGAPSASGKKLSPSDRSQLIGLLTEQMNRCISYSGSAPKTGPQITFTLNRDGSISGGVQLANSAGEPSFRPFAEASMRALRNCQPYRIPARFLETYDDWKNVRLNIDTSDMQ